MATAFNVSVAPSGGDYTTLQGIFTACGTIDLTSAATKVFAISGGITGTMSDNTAVTGVTSGATGTCVHASSVNGQILIKSITGTFQSGEIVYETLGTNYVTLGDAGASPYLNIVISGTWASADTTAVNIVNITTSSSNNVVISTSGSAKNTTGIWNTSYYVLSGSNASDGILDINTQNVTLNNLQIINTNTPASGNAAAIRTNSTATANGLIVENCIFRGGRFTARLDSAGSGNTMTQTFINCLFYGGNVGAIAMIAATSTSYFYNCIIIGGSAEGILTSGSGITSVLKNCYASYSSSGAAYNNTASGTNTLTTSASNDTTGSTGLQNIPYTTATFNNVTSGSENFNLVSGSSLILAGTNESGTFTTDITGATRQATGAWDIGAFYYASSGPAITNGIMNLKTGWWGDL